MANDNRLKLLSLRLAERLQRGEKLIKESMRTLQTDAAKKPETTDRRRRPRSRKERSRSVEKDVTRSSRLHRSPPKGYDFIAGLLDRNAADSLVMAKSDDFYAEVAQFRKLNREECYGVSLSDLQKSDPALSDSVVSYEDESSGSEVSDSEDYVLNDRLYPVRVPHWKDKKGTKAKSFQSRGKIRISIPRHLDPEKDFPTIA
ncbi:uncharacterized protein [Oscarella lobularis]|uniref:uncharacterized protein isoform X2 n=1 Tax=Oscarella lobularis TaxID=121494 RepID=UPI0033134E01